MILLTIPEAALAYEDGWLEYTRLHKAPKRKAALESYRGAAHDAAWNAQNKAQLKKVANWMKENHMEGWQIILKEAED